MLQSLQKSVLCCLTCMADCYHQFSALSIQGVESPLNPRYLSSGLRPEDSFSGRCQTRRRHNSTVRHRNGMLPKGQKFRTSTSKKPKEIKVTVESGVAPVCRHRRNPRATWRRGVSAGNIADGIVRK